MPPRKKPKTSDQPAEDKAAAAAKSDSPDVEEEVSQPPLSPRTRSGRGAKGGQEGPSAVAAAPDAGPADSKQRRTGARRKYGGGGTTSADANGPYEGAANGAVTGGGGAKGGGGRGGGAGRGRREAAVAGAGAGGAGDADSDTIMEAVVKVFCVHTEPNYSLPWQRKRQYSSSSSGFLLPGRRILTNAHCVDHYTQVKVKRRGSDVKHVATVLSVGTECDIALLTVADDAFWEGVQPVTFGQLPTLQDAVTVVGYPIGGDTMSVTSGVVSRIEVTAYTHGSSELLGIQIDAAINSGNSGGPAFNEAGECVGIAFQSLKHEDAENIGYIIPIPVVEHFLTDYERHGRYTGFPSLGVEWQKLENPDLRAALNMQADQKGVLIRRVEPTAAVSAVLRPNDVLLAFDGTPIANDGTVPFRSGERISFSYLVSTKYTDEQARLRVLQGGEVKEVEVGLRAGVRLVPFHTRGLPPSYFIVAGLVFTTVTVPYLKSEYGKDYDYEAPVKLLDALLHGMAGREGEQVVVLSQVLAADVNLGYEDICNTQVVSLNGQPIHDLAELVARVDGCSEPYLHFDLQYNIKVVLGTPKAKASTPDILAVHCIAADRSPDLMQGGQGQGQAGGQSGVNGQANGPVKDGEGAGAGEAEDEDGGDKGKEKEKGAKGGKGGKASGKAKR